MLNRDRLIVGLVLVDILLIFAALASRNVYVGYVLSFFILVSGLWLLWATIISMRSSAGSKRWVKVPYQVCDARFDWEMPSAPGRHSKFIPHFLIQYHFDGTNYTRSSNEDLNLSDKRVFSTNQKAQEYLDATLNYQYGEFVYVNPNDPKVAYLRAGIGRNQLSMLVFALILILLPVLTHIFAIQWR